MEEVTSSKGERPGSKIRVSVVSYTNSLPFLYGLENSPIRDKIEITKDIPSECAYKLANGLAEVGIVPVGSLDDYPEYQVISRYCIGTQGGVDSVFIFSHKPIEDVKTIRLDSHSRTSNGLARILVRRHWKKEVEWVHDGETDAIVLIGDRTFGQKQVYPHVYDLSIVWKELTGLPFAFALWVSSVPLPKEFCDEFDAAILVGLQQRSEIAAALPVRTDIDLEYYLTKSIDYTYDKPKQEAVQLYLKWLRELA